MRNDKKARGIIFQALFLNGKSSDLWKLIFPVAGTKSHSVLKQKLSWLRKFFFFRFFFHFFLFWPFFEMRKSEFFLNFFFHIEFVYLTQKSLFLLNQVVKGSKMNYGVLTRTLIPLLRTKRKIRKLVKMLQWTFLLLNWGQFQLKKKMISYLQSSHV